VGVLGLTYKAGTSTLRRSAALEIIADLTAQGAIVKAFDPKADPAEVKKHKEFRCCDNPYEAAEGADALVIVTDWPEFKGLDFNLIKSAMKRPVIIDTRNMLDDRRLVASGLTYFGVGRGK
jgi:UDPglucose 6-dehydrogenase